MREWQHTLGRNWDNEHSLGRCLRTAWGCEFPGLHVLFGGLSHCGVNRRSVLNSKGKYDFAQRDHEAWFFLIWSTVFVQFSFPQMSVVKLHTYIWKSPEMMITQGPWKQESPCPIGSLILKWGFSALRFTTLEWFYQPFLFWKWFRTRVAASSSLQWAVAGSKVLVSQTGCTNCWTTGANS